MKRNIVIAVVVILAIAASAVVMNANQSKANYVATTPAATSTSVSSGTPVQVEQEEPKRYESQEYKFAFQYPVKAVAYDKKSDRMLNPPSGDPIIAWVELPETYESPVVDGVDIPVRIEIVEGDYSARYIDLKEYTAVKVLNGKMFTIRYAGPIGVDQPSQKAVEAYSLVRESFAAIEG